MIEPYRFQLSLSPADLDSDICRCLGDAVVRVDGKPYCRPDAEKELADRMRWSLLYASGARPRGEAGAPLQAPPAPVSPPHSCPECGHGLIAGVERCGRGSRCKCVAWREQRAKGVA